MNSTTVNKLNPFFNNKIESLCIVCNNDLSKCESKSVQDILPEVDPPTTVFEALKQLSNFQQLSIDNEQLRICHSCFLKTSLSRWFQLLCNKSAANIKAYIDNQVDVKCSGIIVEEIEDVQNNVQNENKDQNYLNFMSAEVKTEEIEVTYDGPDEDTNDDQACEAEPEFEDCSSDGSEDSEFDPDYSDDKKSKKDKKESNGTESKTKPKRVRVRLPVPKKECPHCHVMYRRDYLSIHVRIHTGVMPHVCKQCGKGFKCKSSLTNHMLYHNNERNFLCTFCGSGFHLKIQLDNHIRIHTDERPYVCETCGKAFRTSTARRIHYSVHTDVKNYACEKCPKTFSTSRSLRQHKVVHAEIKPFECTFCGKRFPHRHVLKSHQAKTCQRINAS